MVSPSHPIINLLHVLDKIYPKTKLHKGRGRPPVYSELVIVKIMLVMLLKKIKKYKQLERYLNLNPTVAMTCGLEKSPHRKTLKLRIEGMSKKMRKRIRVVSKTLLKVLDYEPKTCALDSSLIAACGPLWHKKDRKAGRIPKGLRNVDTESTWGFSAARGWVQGYKGHAMIIADPLAQMIPTDSDLTGAHVPDNIPAPSFIKHLPTSVKYLLADGAYDDQKLIDLCEQRKHGKNITRRLVVPIGIKKHTPEKRRKLGLWFASPFAQKLYQQRSTSIEPFWERLKRLFEIDPTWKKGKNFATVLFQMAVLTYLLIMFANIRNFNHPADFQAVLGGL